jgi:hypothetical protein
VQERIAGDLKEYVREKEETSAEPVNYFAEAKVIKHLKSSEANVYSVQIGEQVSQKKDRKDPE